MSLVAILLLATAAAPPPADNEILVLAQKLRLLEVDVNAGRRDGKLELRRCRVTRGSGDPTIDAIPCDTARRCLADASPPTTRKELGICVERLSERRIDALAAERRAARGDDL
jgi:hypothetical protein